jgi:hypothetical protein
MALFIWLIIRLIQLVFSAGTLFFSHKKSANSVFQPAYNSSRTAPLYASASRRPPDLRLLLEKKIALPFTFRFQKQQYAMKQILESTSTINYIHARLRTPLLITWSTHIKGSLKTLAAAGRCPTLPIENMSISWP